MPTIAGTIITALVPAALVTGMPTPVPSLPREPLSGKASTELLRAPTAMTEIRRIADSAGGVDNLERLRQQARELAQLPPGWDGDGSAMPSQAALNSALELIDSLPGGLPLPGIMASPDGEIGFYWDLNGGYADLSFSETGEGSFFSRSSDGQEVFITELTAEDFTRAWFFDHLGQFAAPGRRAA